MPVPQQLEAFRQAREDTLQLAAPLSQEQLDRSPAPGKWSAGEVLDHLAKTDAMNRSEIAQLVDLARSGRSPSVKRHFADLDAAPAEVHFRHPEGVTPESGRPAADLSRALRASFQDFVSQLTENPDLDWASMVHQHPLFGVNNVPQILNFITLHERRHQAQILDALRPPQAARS
jgi:uncharacterized damage-inducible protein DinB